MTISEDILQQIANNDPILDKLQLRPESGINDDDVRDLVRAALKGRNTNLKSILITANDISDAGAMELAKLQDIEILGLGGNDVGDEGAIVIAQRMPNLKKLGLGGNNISDKGAKALSGSSLLSLHLYDNNLSNACGEYFLKNNTLIEISLNGNNIDPQTVLKIKEHIASNKARIEREAMAPAKELAINSQNNQNTFFGKGSQKFKENSNNGISPAEQAMIKQGIVSQLKLLSESGQVQLIEDFIISNKLSDKINLGGTRSLIK